MPTSLTLSNPTAVTRTGSTLGWSNLSNSIASDNSYATSAPYNPGDKSELIRYDIAAPASPLASLPPVLTLTVECQVDPDDESGTMVVDDVVQLGTSSGPAGTNVATSVAVPVSDGFTTYDIPTDGIDLATLNAGSAKLFLGFKALPETAYSSSDFTVATAPTSPFGQYTRLSSFLVSFEETATVTVTKTGARPDTYAVVNVTTLSAGGVDLSIAQTVDSGSVVLNDGQSPETTFLLTPEYVLEDTQTTTAKHRALVGVPVPFEMYGITTHTATDDQPLDANAYGTISATVVQPDPTTLKVDSVSLKIADDDISEVVNEWWGNDEQEKPMSFAKIGDTRAAYLQTLQFSTGEAADATGSPAYRVYEMTTDTPILTGSMALLDDSNTVGLYSASYSVSAENGFEVGKTYCVRVSATVAAVATAKIIDVFQVRAVSDMVPADVWSVSMVSESAGIPTTYGGAVRRLTTWIHNRFVKVANLTTLYADDNSSALVSQQFSVTDTGFDRSKAS